MEDLFKDIQFAEVNMRMKQTKEIPSDTKVSFIDYARSWENNWKIYLKFI